MERTKSGTASLPRIVGLKKADRAIPGAVRKAHSTWPQCSPGLCMRRSSLMRTARKKLSASSKPRSRSWSAKQRPEMLTLSATCANSSHRLKSGPSSLSPRRTSLRQTRRSWPTFSRGFKNRLRRRIMKLTSNEYGPLVRSDINAFIERSFYELNRTTPFLPSWHIAKIAAELEACRRGETKRLIINVPPRSLKSLCASIAFPAWLLGHDPSAQIIAASYGQELANKLSSDCRTLLASSF